MKQLPQSRSNSFKTPSRPSEPSTQTPSPRGKFPLKKLALIGVGIAVTGLLIWAFRPAPVRVDVGQVQRGSLQVTVNAEGKTRVRDRFIIAAAVDGHLARIQLNEGDTVKPGMVVATIDPLPANAAIQQALGQLAEWQAQRAGVATQRPKIEAIQQARTRIQAATDRQRQATIRVAEVQATLAQTQRDRDRARQLEATGAIARADREAAELQAVTQAKQLETALFAARVANTEVAIAKAALAIMQQEKTDPDYLLKVYDARIASTEAELANLRDEAARTTLRSPVSGKVLRIQQKSAQYVTAGTPLIEIGDPQKLELVIDVLSTDAETIQPGDPILLEQITDSHLDSTPISAKVRRVEPSAFTKVSALGVEEQRVNVIGDLIQTVPTLGDAYRIDAQIVVWRGEHILKTPISALFRCHQNNWCVFTVREGKAHQQTVVIGHRSDREAEVNQGLTQGDSVVLHPTEQIKDGSQVAIQN